MNFFFNVLQQCIQSKKIIYPSDPFETYDTSRSYNEYNCVYSYIYSIIYEIYFITKNSAIKNMYLRNAHIKLTVLNKYLNNIFISDELKEKILEVFSKAQRIYFAMAKFANIYRYKKWPLVVTDDLSLNPLDINNKHTIVILQNKARYLFCVTDLINLIETAICNAPNFFIQPLSPKNPFNNQKLSTSILCNIYFKMRENNGNYSVILHLFFLNCFVKQQFFVNNEPFLREYAIKKFVYNTPSETLHPHVLSMLKINYYTKKLLIHTEFPKDVLVNIFRPYLFYYYVIHYGIKGTEKIHIYKKKLSQNFKKFYEYNKFFGRKTYITNQLDVNKTQLTTIFNSKHINFYDIGINNGKTEFKILSILNEPTVLRRRIQSINSYNNVTNYDQDELFYDHLDNYTLDNPYSNEFNHHSYENNYEI
jgi:hypothetical protein